MDFKLLDRTSQSAKTKILTKTDKTEGTQKVEQTSVSKTSALQSGGPAISLKPEQEAVAVEKSIRKISSTDIGARASLASLSDVSQEMMTELAPPKTIDNSSVDKACKNLWKHFKVSSNKITYAANGELKTSLQDILFMKDNPLASAKSQSMSRTFRAFACMQYTSESVDFLDQTKKMLKMKPNHPNFDKQLKFICLNFIPDRGKQTINLPGGMRERTMDSYEQFVEAEIAYRRDPSPDKQETLLAKKVALLENINSCVGEMHSLLRKDTFIRFADNHQQFINDNQGRSLLGQIASVFKHSPELSKLEQSRIKSNRHGMDLYRQHIYNPQAPSYQSYGL